MIKFDALSRTVAAIVCTIAFSSACVLGAVGPAQADAAPTIQIAISTLA